MRLLSKTWTFNCSCVCVCVCVWVYREMNFYYSCSVVSLTVYQMNDVHVLYAHDWAAVVYMFRPAEGDRIGVCSGCFCRINIADRGRHDQVILRLLALIVNILSSHLILHTSFHISFAVKTCIAWTLKILRKKNRSFLFILFCHRMNLI